MRLLIWDSDGTLGYRPSGEWSSAMDETAETKVPTLGVEPEDLAPHLQSGFPWHHPTCAQIDTASSDAWWSSLHPILRATFPPVGGDLARAHTPGTRAAPVSIQVAHASPPARCPPWTDGWRTDGWIHVPELQDIVVHLGVSSGSAAVFNSARIGYEKPRPRTLDLVLELFLEAVDIDMLGDRERGDVAQAGCSRMPAIVRRRESAPPWKMWRKSCPDGLWETTTIRVLFPASAAKMLSIRLDEP